MNDPHHLFHEAVQRGFWRSVQPDAQLFLDAFERNEGWTFTPDEFPELYSACATALGMMEAGSPQANPSFVLRRMIIALSSMPFRQCISALAWLDRHGSNDGSWPGWAIEIYLEADRIHGGSYVDADVSPELQGHAKVVVERINTFLTTQSATAIFSNIQTVLPCKR